MRSVYFFGRDVNTYVYTLSKNRAYSLIVSTEPAMNRLAQVIRDQLGEQKMSIEDLIRETGRTRGQLGPLLRGETKRMDPDVVNDVAKAIGLRVEVMLNAAGFNFRLTPVREISNCMVGLAFFAVICGVDGSIGGLLYAVSSVVDETVGLAFFAVRRTVGSALGTAISGSFRGNLIEHREPPFSVSWGRTLIRRCPSIVLPKRPPN